MMKFNSSRIPTLLVVCSLIALTFLATPASAQDGPAARDREIYTQLKAFSLTGGVVEVKDLELKRDRVQLMLTGVVYLSAPIDGQTTGAVFIGNGRFVAETPPSEFERENVKRLIGSDGVASDFKTAVFRFTDDTAAGFGSPSRNAGPANDRAQKLAREADERVMRQVGANLPARLAVSMLNAEKPGFFFATFDGGNRGRFSMVLDHQTRLPVSNFGINAGEKGLIWSYDSPLYFNEVWMAFYSLDDYERGTVAYSDASDQIDIKHYRMNVDLRAHKDMTRLQVRLEAEPNVPNVRALTFNVGEGLGERDDERLKKTMRIKSVRRAGVDLFAVQEDWQSGFNVFLPAALKAGEKLELDMTFEGDFVRNVDYGDSFLYVRSLLLKDVYYPRSNTTWYPRHGDHDRATYDMTFRHPKNLQVASVGARTSEGPDPEDKDGLVSRYEMKLPVSFVTFALGPFKRYHDTVKWESGNTPTPLEFNSMPGDLVAIKEDFMLAEINNSVRYFTLLFGDYPYPVFAAAFHPFAFGQGFPSLLMIPPTDRDSKFTYHFIAHETAHQWWGNIVSWRSYRDQWLSEGFAHYSGLLYIEVRKGEDAKKEVLGRMRSGLKDPPLTLTGPGKGRLVDVGPIILGRRLNTTKTLGAYQTLIYDKGALVLRMLHFMLSDPNTGDGQPFFKMMTDFVGRYRNKTASSDDFRVVVNEHFAKSPLARRYGMKSLDWLFTQAVYQTALPSYELRYRIEDQPDGKVLVSGTIEQRDAPADWVMVLPVKFSFGAKNEAVGTVLVDGRSSPFQIKLPRRPVKVELDPDRWILSQGVSTKSN
jgi:hypothetical protein